MAPIELKFEKIIDFFNKKQSYNINIFKLSIVWFPFKWVGNVETVIYLIPV